MLKVFSATNETVHRLSVANGWNMANCSMSYWRCCRIQLQLQLQLAERTLLCAGHASVAFQLRSHLRNAAGGGVITTTMAAGMTISYRTAGRSLMSNNDFWYYERTDGRTDGRSPAVRWCIGLRPALANHRHKPRHASSTATCVATRPLLRALNGWINNL